MNKIVEFKDVYKNFTIDKNSEATEVIEKISFDVFDGEIVCIVGPSGSGKSTILNLISNLIKPTKGTVKVKGTIGYMFQHDHLFEWRTINKNVMLGLEIKKKLDLKSINKVDKMLDYYGLKEFKNHYPSELSGGMRQRVALIRTLAVSPDLLLLDEPFGALDYQTKIKVIEDIYKIIKNENKTAIMVTHDINEAISIADRIIVLSDRPAKIKLNKTIDFGLDRTPIKALNHPDFGKYFQEIWRALNE